MRWFQRSMVCCENGGDPWLVRCVLVVFDADWLQVTLTTLSQSVNGRRTDDSTRTRQPETRGMRRLNSGARDLGLLVLLVPGAYLAVTSTCFENFEPPRSRNAQRSVYRVDHSSSYTSARSLRYTLLVQHGQTSQERQSPDQWKQQANHWQSSSCAVQATHRRSQV